MLTPPAPRSAAARRWLAALALLAAGAATTAARAADPPPGCGLTWRVQARLDTQPRQLALEMIFDAGGRTETTLRLPTGWADLSETGDRPDGAAALPRLLPLPGAPALRRVRHAAGERVHLQWRLIPTGDGTTVGSARLDERWLAFSGQGVLPMPVDADERPAGEACVALSGLAPGGRWVGSHGTSDGVDALWRLPSGTALASRVQQALFAGGALQLHQANALTVALPQDSPWRFSAEALHQATAQAFAAQRRYWGDPPDSAIRPWLLLLMPAASAGDRAGGTAWHQALVLQAATDLAVPGPGFDPLIAEALARAWTAERFGPLAHAGRGDEALRAWFSEGFADFLAHRALLRQSLWTPKDYAAAMNRKIDAYLLASGPGAVAPRGEPLALSAAQGEWLALRWHAALRAAGRPGLEALLQRLQVPPAQARREGPISAPLATHRLLAALRPVMGDAALVDLKRHVELLEPFGFGPAALGPCFVGRQQSVGRWRLGFDPASLNDGLLRGVEPGGPAEAAGLRDGMALRGHALLPGDATQPVWLRVKGPDGRLQELSYLPAGPPQRDLPRYESVDDALQRPDCQGWLGPEAQAAAAVAPQRGATQGKAAATPKSATKARPAAKPKLKPKARTTARPGA